MTVTFLNKKMIFFYIWKSRQSDWFWYVDRWKKIEEGEGNVIFNRVIYSFKLRKCIFYLQHSKGLTGMWCNNELIELPSEKIGQMHIIEVLK